MTPPGDFPFEMDKFPFDDRDADAVFGAAQGSDSAPEELRDVADLVFAARRSGSADELVGADVIVAQIAATVGEFAASPSGDAYERTRVLRKFRTAKLTAAATAVLMFGATAAAAATGSLPSPVQTSVADGLSGVGINLPAHHAHHEVNLAAKHTRPVFAAHLHEGPKATGARGVVASVNGVSLAETCGKDTTGVFTLTGREGATFTVNVGTATTYVDEGVTAPSFANVCVGDIVTVKGALTDMTVTATKVHIKPPHPHHELMGAIGKVASVNGASGADACGTQMAAGVFTLTGRNGATFTVNVATTTTFLDRGITVPSFANVCVGAFVLAKGAVVDTTVTATDVAIAPVHHDDGHKHEHKHQPGVFGTVASVNGSATAGSCGALDRTGVFTVTGHKGATFTVNVADSTKFFAFGGTSPSFADVCVGAKVAAIGDATDTTVAATKVFVLPARTDGPDAKDANDDHGKHGKHRRGDLGKGFGLSHGSTFGSGAKDAGPDHTGSGPDDQEQPGGHGGSGGSGSQD